jgi:peptidoglycan/LPS O-acetylase OafA/YrhL
MTVSHRLDHVDGLRGLAALVVVLQHAMQMVHEAGRNEFDWLLSTVNLGRFGVVLFFLISGCVIPFSFRGERPLRNFAVSRFFRLFPAYWLSIPVLVCVAMTRGQSFGSGAVLGNLTMMQGFWGGANIGPGYWTLNYEMAFYLLCALLFWRGWLKDAGLISALVVGMLGIALWPVVLNDTGHATQAPYFIALFLLGTVLRQAYVDGDRTAHRCAGVLAPLTVLAGAGISGLFRPNEPWPGVGGYFSPLALATSMVLPIVLFVLVLRWRPAMSRLLIWLGAISYSVYLFQDVGLWLLPRAMSLHDRPFLYIALVFFLTIAIAALVHRFVEQPMIALGRRFTHGARQVEPALAAA